MTYTNEQIQGDQGTRMSGILAGAGALVTRQHAVLLVLRERSGEVRWELPSGLLENGESFEDAVTREVFEETNITVVPDDLFCIALMDKPADAYRGVNVYFLAHEEGRGRPRYRGGLEPIQDVAFVDLATLSPRSLHPVDRRILSSWRRVPLRRNFYVHIRL